MVRERPPRLREIRWLRDFFIDRAATPPHEASRGGEYAYVNMPGNSFKPSYAFRQQAGATSIFYVFGILQMRKQLKRST